MRRTVPPKGLRDIRTVSGRDSASPAENVGTVTHALREGLSGVRVRLGNASRGPAVAPRPPHTWVFVPKPRFARHQGELLVEPVAEPNIEVQSESFSVVVLADLPGVSDEEIEIKVHGDVLALSTRPSSPSARRYECEVLLPFPVDPTPLRKNMRNGILEVEFLRAPKVDTAKGDMEGGG